MLFNSLTFLLFLACTALGYFLIRKWQLKKIWLLVASYVFYSAWNPPFVLLLMLSTCVDWTIAKQIGRTENLLYRKLLLACTVMVSLGLLAYFKYSHFLISTFMPSLPLHDIVLPAGISFYTFQTLSYSIDVYRRKIKADAKLLDFALFVAFFPQLVAGPIVRARQFLPQLHHPRRITFIRIMKGMSMFIMGIFQKVVLADSLLAPVADLAFDNISSLKSSEAWLGILAFSGQIFFDFSGYSMCAIGLASCFGYRLPRNFNAPYAARGFSDFWRRWHMTLSQWLRDYLYIPLGGNRKGVASTCSNLMITMMLGGLWHGASWLFVLWGIGHGAMLSFEHALRRPLANFKLKNNLMVQLLLQGFTFVVVTCLWVFFRAKTWADATAYFHKLFSHAAQSALIWRDDSILGEHAFMECVIIACLLLWHLCTRKRPFFGYFVTAPIWVRTVCLTTMIVLIVYQTGGDSRTFVYFQF